MALDLSPPPPYGRGHLRAFPGWRAALGPGIVWMALAQGSGELIWWPYMCAKYGLGLLFLLAPACLVQWPVTFSIGRYSALTGESVWRGFARVSPAFCFVLWLLMAVSFLWFGAFASAGGTALARLVDWPPLDDRGRALFWASVTIAVFATALLRGEGSYGLIEKVMWAVAVVTVIGLGVSVARPELRSAWPEFLRAIVVPAKLVRPFDPADTDRLLTAITFAGLGGFWTLFYSYWVLGKGMGVEAVESGDGRLPERGAADAAIVKQWRNGLVVDSGIGIVGNLLTTFMTCFLAFAILLPKGIVPDQWSLAAEQARFFEVAWGGVGRAVFLVVAAAFLCDTWLSTADAVARVHLEMIRFFFLRGRAIDEKRAYRGMILLLTAVTVATMFSGEPGPLIVLSALIGFVGTLAFVAALVVLLHGRLAPALPPELRPGRVSLVLLCGSLAAYTALALAYLWTRFAA
ncbi:Nramp family divalent metal transporter [Candidatus Binatia bacterium]|jgi:Mn2+/Fe2+ NRAMP family transporter|nr:Nramp family divalent metal transporter [Candidatus Binatia bacterium]